MDYEEGRGEEGNRKHESKMRIHERRKGTIGRVSRGKGVQEKEWGRGRWFNG